MIINENGYWEDEELGLIHRQVYKTVHGNIPKGWVVHHVDGTKLNNRIENLVAMPSHCHDQLHAYQKRSGVCLSKLENDTFVIDYQKQTKFLEKEIRILTKKIEELKKEVKKRKKMHIRNR